MDQDRPSIVQYDESPTRRRYRHDREFATAVRSENLSRGRNTNQRRALTTRLALVS